jgi:hypothetical protein
MTSQSPRIYIYKITFEEVLYYYYGLHKEKKINEYYMGSPVTHKWVWDFYTPKKQILEFFEYSDEGYIEAKEVESRIIRPFYNADKWCLNENCSGVPSLKVCSDAGKIGSKIANEKIRQLKVGIYNISPEQRIENGKKGGKISGQKNKELGLGFFKMSFEEKSQLGKRNAEKNIQHKKAIFSLTPEQRSENGKKGGSAAYKMRVGVHGRSKEQRIENSKKGGSISGKRNYEKGIGVASMTKEERQEVAAKTNSQRWECLETGYISTPAGLSLYQKKRGIDTSKRIRLE